MKRLNNQNRELLNHGALIFTTTKELCSQIYNNLKALDRRNSLKMFRTASLNYDFNHKEKVIPGNKTLESNHYFMSFINWKKADILISTPTQLDILLKTQPSHVAESITPKFVVIDEFDQILTDRKYLDVMTNLLKTLGSDAVGKKATERTIDRKVKYGDKFILSGASMLKTIYGKPAHQYLEQFFPNLNTVQSKRFHKLNPNVSMQDFKVDQLSQDDRFVLTKQLLDRDKPSRVLIFCQEASLTEDLARYLSSEGIPSAHFHAKQSDADRSSALYRLHQSQLVALVCTDLACRGIDFQNVSLIIQFDYAENGINLLHRIGRTGRLGANGKVISFVDIKDQELYNEFTDTVKEDKTLDQIFSRNRSFSKKLKKLEN